MKLHQTGHKNSLRVETLSSLLMISVNDPPPAHWSYNTRHCVHGFRQAVCKETAWTRNLAARQSSCDCGSCNCNTDTVYRSDTDIVATPAVSLICGVGFPARSREFLAVVDVSQNSLIFCHRGNLGFDQVTQVRQTKLMQVKLNLVLNIN